MVDFIKSEKISQVKSPGLQSGDVFMRKIGSRLPGCNASTEQTDESSLSE